MAEAPKVISNKLFKIFSYAFFSDFSNNDNSNTNLLTVFTANGIYRGKLKRYESDEVMGDLTNEAKIQEYLEQKDYASIIRLTYLNYIKSAYSDFDQKAPFDNGITITLEDVTLTSLELKGRINMPFVDIFVDQIIAITIGDMSKADN